MPPNFVKCFCSTKCMKEFVADFQPHNIVLLASGETSSYYRFQSSSGVFHAPEIYPGIRSSWRLAERRMKRLHEAGFRRPIKRLRRRDPATLRPRKGSIVSDVCQQRKGKLALRDIRANMSTPHYRYNVVQCRYDVVQCRYDTASGKSKNYFNIFPSTCIYRLGGRGRFLQFVENTKKN